MKYQLTAEVKGKKVQWDNPALAVNTISQFEGKRICITISRESKKRSDRQNRYYWGVVIEMVWSALRGLGNEYSREQIHDMMRDKFLRVPEVVDKNTGEVLTFRTRHTPELSTLDFNQYFEQVIRWAAEFLGIAIPLPNEEWYRMAA